MGGAGLDSASFWKTRFEDSERQDAPVGPTNRVRRATNTDKSRNTADGDPGGDFPPEVPGRRSGFILFRDNSKSPVWFRQSQGFPPCRD